MKVTITVNAANKEECKLFDIIRGGARGCMGEDARKTYTHHKDGKHLTLVIESGEDK